MGAARLFVDSFMEEELMDKKPSMQMELYASEMCQLLFLFLGSMEMLCFLSDKEDIGSFCYSRLLNLLRAPTN